MANNIFQIQLKVNNIGPHFGDQVIDFNDKVESNKAVFYALNGTGKTFVSRALRLSETIPEDFDASKVLSIGTTNGSLLFDVITNQDKRVLSVDIESGRQPVISNSLDLKFHVFNSDFVDENVKAKSFSPDGNIEGYILGKIQIDISDEKTRETEIKKEIESLRNSIDNTITKAKRSLYKNGVQPNTLEMRLFVRDRVKTPERQDITDTFEQILDKLDTLKNVPEQIEDVTWVPFTFPEKTLEDATTLLNTEYPQSSWDEEFVAIMRQKRAFVEAGLRISPDDSKCPFCGRVYDDYSLEIIRQYRAYLSDKQTQIQKEITLCKQNLQAARQSVEDFIANTKVSSGEISSIAKFFPSLVHEQLTIPVINFEFVDLIVELEDLLDKKSDNLSAVFKENESWRRIWQIQNTLLSEVSKSNEAVIQKVNKTKNNANGERLSLRKELCKAKYIECCDLCADEFAQLAKEEDELRNLQGSIKYKEQQSKVSKKEKVFDTLEYLLNQFFFDKYTIDPETFEIQFLGKKLGNKATNVLSDGEKGIVAFCLYLAYTHQLIESEEDYEKLFFVIDDPISSLDFNYVYAVAQTIKDIKTIFSIQGHERIWIFTHNLEFLNMIARNHVLPNVYLMTPGRIEKYDYKLLMPYESHLHDIVCIANGSMEPSHTTGNSIRHIIETIAKFEDPQIGLEKYMQNNEILSSNSAVYSMCQDLSHGNMRSEPPYTKSIMISACQIVKSFVEGKYPEQIANVRE